MRKRKEIGAFSNDHHHWSFKCAIVLIVACALLIAGCSKKANTGNSPVSINAGKIVNINSSNNS